MLPCRARKDLGAMAIKGHCDAIKGQSSSIAGTSLSDCLVSYSGHSLEGGLTPLQRCSQCILQPQLTGHIGLLGYLMPNALYTYILNMIWFGWFGLAFMAYQPLCNIPIINGCVK